MQLVHQLRVIGNPQSLQSPRPCVIRRQRRILVSAEALDLIGQVPRSPIDVLDRVKRIADAKPGGGSVHQLH
ncbi:hypothetical protein D1872_313850 [compost metagenome]